MGSAARRRRAAYYLGFNRNKRDLVLNLEETEARNILGELMREADVLVENYKAGTLDRWGFDRTWMETHAPKFIHCSITGYGPEGPRSSDPGYDFILQAETGLMSITGLDGDPTKHGVAIVDITTGLLATIAILGALKARERTGLGQFISTSLLESGIMLLANVASNFLIPNKEPGRYGNGHPNIVPYRTFATADGEIAVAVGNDRQFERLSRLAGRPEWVTDPTMASNEARVVNREAVDRAVDEAIACYTSDWWLQQLKAVGIPCGRVNTVSQALADPQVLARQMTMTVDHPTVGELRLLGFPYKLAKTPNSVRHYPPLFGEHTDEILSRLGYSATAIDDLASRGVVQRTKR
jgi:crotonobetainyl-CoA:carnitine CoA-transferase CaiB-like acyl-CoA transferase